MQIKIRISKRLRQRVEAFSLVEATVGLGVIGTVMVSLFSGFTSGFFTMQMARENLRATQILMEKTETLRLYSWDQVNTAGFIPTTFTALYDPNAPSGSQGMTYQGTVTISASGLGTSYADEMRKVTAKVTWKTGAIDREREFTTYIARNGLQSYIY